MTAPRAAILYAGLLCLLYALVPALTFPNPPLDVVEGFAWGREMQLGYTKHPPMQAWLLEASFRLTGGQVFGGYVLSALSAAAGYLFIWILAGRLGLTQWQGFWAIVLTSVTFYFTLPMPEFNPNILQIPVWAGMIYFFHRALASGSLLDWILLGAIAAFGLYTKYFVILLIGTIGLYALVFADARRHLATAGPWLCAIVCLALLIPHILWLLQTDFLTLQYAASRSRSATSWVGHLYNPLNFLGAQIGNHGAILVVALAGMSWTGLKSIRTTLKAKMGDTFAPPDDRFLLWFAFLPITIVVAASAVTGNEFEHMWGTPMFVCSGLVAVRYLQLPALWAHPARALGTTIVIHAIFLGVLFGQAVFEPFWKSKQTRLHYPGAAVAQVIDDIWKKEMGTGLAYVAGDMWSAANVTLNAPSRPSMFYLHDTELSPWIDLEDVQRKGLIIVWRGEQEVPLGQIARFYPGAVRQGSAVVPYRPYGIIPDVRVNWLIIPPGKVATAPASP